MLHCAKSFSLHDALLSPFHEPAVNLSLTTCQRPLDIHATRRLFHYAAATHCGQSERPGLFPSLPKQSASNVALLTRIENRTNQSRTCHPTIPHGCHSRFITCEFRKFLDVQDTITTTRTPTRKTITFDIPLPDTSTPSLSPIPSPSTLAHHNPPPQYDNEAPNTLASTPQVSPPYHHTIPRSD